MQIANRYPPLEIPAVSLSELVLQRAHELGDKPAIVDVDSGRGYSYAQVGALVTGVAAHLAPRGERRERLAVLLPNVPEFPIVFHGIVRSGGVVTTLNPSYTKEEIAYQLGDSGARVLITDEANADKAREALAEIGGEAVYVLGRGGEPGALDPFLCDGPAPRVELDPATALAAMPYSSGTTGLPKGVMLSHRNLVANLLQTAASQEVEEDDVLAGSCRSSTSTE